MARKYTKRTDDEWLAMLQDCMSSGMTIKAWCQQHGITCKAFYYHRRVLCQMGYDIPQRQPSGEAKVQQEAFCVDLSERQPARGIRDTGGTGKSSYDAAIRIDLYGISIEISNQAAPDTVSNTLSALQALS